MACRSKGRWIRRFAGRLSASSTPRRSPLARAHAGSAAVTATEEVKAEGPSADDYALVAKAAAEVEAPDLPYRPPMPGDRSAPIALVGAGGISAAHLDAYARYGLSVVAICSRDLERARARRDAHFPNAGVTDDFDSVLRDQTSVFSTSPPIRMFALISCGVR